MTEYLIPVYDHWEEITLADLLELAYSGIDFGEEPIAKLYTGVKDIKGNKIYDGDTVLEYGHYHNSDKTTEQIISFKPNHGAWLRGDYQRLTPKNVKLYQIEVVKR